MTVVGIDLGTSNSVVAWVNEAGQIGVVTDRNGVRVHPSVISFGGGDVVGGVIVGAEAKPRRVVDPRNTVYSFKRLMGQTASSVAVRQFRARVPFTIEENPSNQLPMIQTRAGAFSPVELSAIMLDHLRDLATAHARRPVTHAVITVPANFNDAQRSATASAGAIAGLEIVRVLNEPTAAALAYGATRQLNETIAVFDFGGGTFDLTVMKLENQTYTVLGTAGDSFLGGDDIDERIVELMLAQVIHDHRVDLRDDIFAMMKLRSIAEEIKIALSTQGRQKIVIPDLGLGAHGEPITLEFTLTHAELVELMGDLVDRAMSVTRDALSIAQVKTERISDVILVGGTTRIPYIRNRVATFFERAARTDVSPEDAVAIGAALQAASLDLVLAEPVSVSTSSKSGYSHVEKMPATVAPPRAVVDIDDAIAATDLPVLDIDEAIDQTDWPANEASVEVPIEFDLKTPPPPIPRRLVIDVTPNSFGVGTLGGFCEILISRSSPLPVMIKKSYATVRDAQEAVRIVVCQGEARKLSNNVVLGDVVLDNLPKLPRGDVEIEVAFVLDQSGMLQVSARDAKSGHSREVQLDLIGRMSDAELAAARDRMSRLGLGTKS